MAQRRLFFGIPVSPATRKSIARVMLPWQGLPIIPTHPDSLHVTMFFLGFVDDTELPAICASAEEAASGVEPFDLEFSVVNLAPEDRDPDMIWLSGEPSDGALRLNNALTRAFTTRRPEGRSFRPHITLAKLRKRHWNALDSRPSLPMALHAMETVSSVTLFESVSEEGKRKYVAIDEFPLGTAD